MRRYLIVAFLAACGPSVAGTGDDDQGGGGGGGGLGPDAAIADSAPMAPDARTVACPPGLPDGFGNLGTVTSTKNGPGSPAMYDTYNLFVNLQGNKRWFFAMNLDVGTFTVNQTINITGNDTDETKCQHCVNLFADLDTVQGGPSLHMFAMSGKVTVTSISADKTSISGHMEDVFFDAIEIMYDDQSISCGDDVNDPVCGNAICLSHHCGRQEHLAGCSTNIKSMTF